MVDRLKGKTAIVFGAGSSGPGWGNGKAAAVAYAREGARVACVDLVREAAEETAAIIANEGGRRDRGRGGRHRYCLRRSGGRAGSRAVSAASTFCTTMWA